MTMEAQIQHLIDKFTEKVEKDPEMKKEIEPLKKTLNFDLGEEKYSMKLENAAISEFKAELIENADVTVITTAEHFQQLLDGDLRPMKAYLTKKISIKGKIQDLMFLKKFL